MALVNEQGNYLKITTVQFYSQTSTIFYEENAYCALTYDLYESKDIRISGCTEFQKPFTKNNMLKNIVLQYDQNETDRNNILISGYLTLKNNGFSTENGWTDDRPELTHSL
jgi:hypothetical protein